MGWSSVGNWSYLIHVHMYVENRSYVIRVSLVEMGPRWWVVRGKNGSTAVEVDLLYCWYPLFK